MEIQKVKSVSSNINSNLKGRIMFYKQQKKKQSENSKNRLKLLQNPTKSELVLKYKLDLLKVKYIFQKGFWKGDFSCIVDFYLPKPYKLCIEVDGAYHNDEKQKFRDAFKDKYLTEERGFRIIRLTNDMADNITLNELKKLII